jgi:hypothetical protein
VSGLSHTGHTSIATKEYAEKADGRIVSDWDCWNLSGERKSIMKIIPHSRQRAKAVIGGHPGDGMAKENHP